MHYYKIIHRNVTCIRSPRKVICFFVGFLVICCWITLGISGALPFAVHFACFRCFHRRNGTVACHRRREHFLLMNAKGIIQFANAGVTSMLGWTQNDLVGSNIAMLMNPEVGVVHDSYLARCGPHFLCETRHLVVFFWEASPPKVAETNYHPCC